MKLSMEALKERADAVASTELLNSISGGTENDCHGCQSCADQAHSMAAQSALGKWLTHTLFH